MSRNTFNDVSAGNSGYFDLTTSSRARVAYELTSGQDLKLHFGNGGHTDVMLVYEEGTTFTAGTLDFLDRFGQTISFAGFAEFSNYGTIEVDPTDPNAVCAVDTIKCNGITWTGDTEVWIYKII